MRRREFLGVLGSAAAMPLVAHAQQRERMRRVGVLMHLAADDPEGQARNAAFLQGLEALGWSVGRNVASIPDGSLIPIFIARTRRNWWRLRRMC